MSLRSLLGDNRPFVRIYTLARYAEVSPERLLNIVGGGINVVRLNPAAAPVALPSLFLTALLTLPYSRVNQRQQITVRLHDEDRRPIVDPVIELQMDTRRMETASPSDDFPVAFAVSLSALPRLPLGYVLFYLELNGEELATLPLKIVPAEGS